MTQDIPQEIVERMVALTRWFADEALSLSDANRIFGRDAAAEAQEIVALLPKPIDPDLLEAREIAAQNGVAVKHALPWVEGTRAGTNDDTDDVACALAGIKRGRELAGGSQ